MEKQEVNKSYLMSVVKTAGIVLLAFIAGKISVHCFTDVTITPIVALVSRSLGILIVGAAVLGRMGWKIQTWDGETPAEKQNLKLFRVMYYFGIFFSALSIYLQ